MLVHQLIDDMIPDQPFAIVRVADDGREAGIYAGDGRDEEWDELYNSIGNERVCNFQAYQDIVIIIV